MVGYRSRLAEWHLGASLLRQPSPLISMELTLIILHQLVDISSQARYMGVCSHSVVLFCSKLPLSGPMLLYDSNPMLQYMLPEISIDPLVPGRNMTDTCRVESRVE